VRGVVKGNVRSTTTRQPEDPVITSLGCAVAEAQLMGEVQLSGGYFERWRSCCCTGLVG
jgi:hypothetical protein